MGSLFSTSGSKIKTASITDVDKAMLTLKTQRKKLQDQQKLLEARIDRHVEVAAALLKEKKRDRALLALKKKKLQEKQLEQVGVLVLNTEDMISNIEMTKHQSKLMSVLQEGNKVLKQLQQKVSVEDVQQLMEDTAEAKAYQDELNAVLGQSLTATDDEEVEVELAGLEALMLDEEVTEMPSVPATKVQQAMAAKEATAAADVDVEVDETQGREKVAMLAA